MDDENGNEMNPEMRVQKWAVQAYKHAESHELQH